MFTDAHDADFHSVINNSLLWLTALENNGVYLQRTRTFFGRFNDAMIIEMLYYRVDEIQKRTRQLFQEYNDIADRFAALTKYVLPEHPEGVLQSVQ